MENLNTKDDPGNNTDPNEKITIGNIANTELIQTVSLYCEILHSAGALIMIFDMKENRFVWFNECAKETFGPKIKNHQLSAGDYLNYFLAKNCHHLWDDKINQLQKDNGHSHVGIIKLEFQGKSFHVCSVAKSISLKAYSNSDHFVEVGILINEGQMSSIINLVKSAKSRGFLNNENIKTLTCREKEIADLVTQGLTSHEIATHLNISKHTVQTHRKNIRKKMGVKNLTWQGLAGKDE